MNKRKWLAALVFLIGLTGCSGAGSVDRLAPVAEDHPYKDKKEIEVMAWWPVNIEPDDEVVKFINRKFNVELKLTVADWQPNVENLPIRVASGDYPNYVLIPWYWVNSLAPQYASLIEDGLIVNISEAAARYGFTHIEQQLAEATEAGVEHIYADRNGDYYSIPRNDGFPNQALFIRKDWLDQLNLPMPRTWGDVETILQAFVEHDPDGRGNVGWTSEGLLGFEHLLTSYTGVHTSGWTKREGQWTYKIMLPEFKEGVRFLNRLYEQGLIDKEFMYLKHTNAREKLTTGLAGIMIVNANSVDYNNFILMPLKDYQADAEVALPVPFPVGPYGQYRNSGDPYGSTGLLFANRDEETNKRMLAILDWLLTEEGTMLSLNGIEGIHYTVDGGAIVYDEEQWQKDFKGIEHHFLRHLIYPGVAKEESPRLVPVLQDNYQDIIEHGVKPEIVGVSTEATAVIEPQLSELYAKWMYSFIVGEADIDNDWPQFIQEYKDAGYDTMLQAVTEFAAAVGK